MPYETRLQMGDYLITIDIEGNHRRGYGTVIFFERATDASKAPCPAVKHAVPDRFTVPSKAHRAALQYAASLVTSGEVGL